MEERGSTWLCDAAARERLLEMSGRVRVIRAAVFVLQALTLAACAPWLGWWTLAPLGVAVVGFRVGDHLMPRVRRPEYVWAATWVLAQLAILLASVLSGGPHSPDLLWFAIPVASLAGRLTSRGLVAGVAVTLVFLLVATVGVDPQAVIDEPYLVAFPAVAVCAIALLSAALMASEVHHRSESVVDPLTQMLNRKALTGRVAELAQQSAVSGEPVGVVVADIDRFKAVNDARGHQAGDAVLRDVAYRLRKSLRAYDLAYRLGGEEFLVLLPGATLAETTVLAERLCAAVRDTPVAGVPLTMSFGVAACAPGEGFDFERLYARADAALYEAKRGGRDRVCGGGAGALAAA